MKKRAIIGLLFTGFIFASCGLKGGTIEVINGSNTYKAHIYIMEGKDGITPVVVAKTADANGGKATFSIDEDGTYTVEAVFYSGSTPSDGQLEKHDKKYAVLSGGKTETVHVTP